MTTPTLTPITQEEFVRDVKLLAAAIAADTDWTPTFLIGVGRGGLIPAAFLSHAAGLPMLSVDYSTQVPDFAADLLVKLALRTQQGEHMLFVDDINDSGRTIHHLRAAMAAAGGVAAHVRFATLIDNVSSMERVDYRAQTIDRTVRKDWFVFPWEAVAPAAAIVDDAAAVPERIA